MTARRIVAALIGRPALRFANWLAADPDWNWCRNTPGLIDRAHTDWAAINTKFTRENR